ncbi:flagellar basal body rod protein FlgB [Pseudobdellovibrio exovorus]|uniref:Flagellar basal body rod protein FlgB n=1 Tax=Pseudobdellovibrio exovorus JSS TaxID=1184267 RepID=M4VD02_9BACT|nr:flagellar basal body rod protein FlgB [Pseudobdellovibrio exovorus]AGH96365.1 flagellar basal-body rod protein FlgB [Pseudobdellovibrio exovorus JSS]
MSSNLFDKTTAALATSLAMRQIRHNVTAANIANADTPNYHAKKVDFEDALSRALDMDGNNSLTTSHMDHYAVGGKMEVTPGIYENPDVAVSNDGNTVDRDKEMAALAENSIMYKAALQLINKKMAAMKYAISETK